MTARTAGAEAQVTRSDLTNRSVAGDADNGNVRVVAENDATITAKLTNAVTSGSAAIGASAARWRAPT